MSVSFSCVLKEVYKLTVLPITYLDKSVTLEWMVFLHFDSITALGLFVELKPLSMEFGGQVRLCWMPLNQSLFTFLPFSLFFLSLLFASLSLLPSAFSPFRFLISSSLSFPSSVSTLYSLWCCHHSCRIRRIFPATECKRQCFPSKILISWFSSAKFWSRKKKAGVKETAWWRSVNVYMCVIFNDAKLIHFFFKTIIMLMTALVGRKEGIALSWECFKYSNKASVWPKIWKF